MVKLGMTLALMLSLIACSTLGPPHINSELQQGKRDFEAGFYKRSMHRLLPLACDGIPEAQYGIGYMYYYGYGVTQDTDTGYFWISRAALKNYLPAIKALTMIEHHQAK